MFWSVLAQATFFVFYLAGICIIGAYWLNATFNADMLSIDDIKYVLLWTIIGIVWVSVGLAVLVDCKIMTTGLVCK